MGPNFSTCWVGSVSWRVGLDRVTKWTHGQLCPPVCPFVCLKPVLYRNEWTDRAGFWRGSFLRPILHCVVRKFGYLQNKGTFLRNFVSNSGLRKFRHGKSIVLSIKLIDAPACWPHLLRSTRNGWTHIVYYTSVDHDALTSLLRFVVDCGFVVQLVPTVVHEKLTRFRLTARTRASRAISSRLCLGLSIKTTDDLSISRYPGMKV